MRAAQRMAAGIGLATTIVALTACGPAGTATPAATPAAATPTPAPVTATPAPPPPPPAGAPAAAGDACALLTDGEVAALSGRTPTAKKGNTVAPEPGKVDCYWSAAGRSVVTLRTYTAPVDVAAQVAELRSGLFADDEAASPGVGEESFYRLAGYGETANIVFRQGGTAYYLTVSNPADEPVDHEQEAAGREKLVVAAREVLANAG